MLSSAALDQELQGRLGWAYTFVRDDALPWAVAGLLLVLCWKLLRAVYSMVLGPAPRKAHPRSADPQAADWIPSTGRSLRCHRGYGRLAQRRCSVQLRRVMRSYSDGFAVVTLECVRWKAENPNPNSCLEIPCWDPSTLESLPSVKAMQPDEVRQSIDRAREAQRTWKSSTFDQRRLLLSTMLRCITENSEAIARVACVDSGKTIVDAMVGEILVTCEKLRWTIADGETHLKPEYRWSGLMNLHKTSRVQWTPVGEAPYVMR